MVHDQGEDRSHIQGRDLGLLMLLGARLLPTTGRLLQLPGSGCVALQKLRGGGADTRRSWRFASDPVQNNAALMLREIRHTFIWTLSNIFLQTNCSVRMA